MYHRKRPNQSLFIFSPTGLHLTVDNIVAHLAIPAAAEIERAVEVVVAHGQRTPNQLQEHVEYLTTCAVAH